MINVKKLLKTKEFTLGTHLPVLSSILEVFEPLGIVELGVGLKSTPLLYNYGKELLSIESDLEWLKKVEQVVAPRNDVTMVHHDIGHDVNVKTKYNQISAQVLEECMEFYNALTKDKYFDFLFIDHVSGLRIHTLIELFDRFQVVAYHDAQHPGYYFDRFSSVDSSDYLHFMFESLGVYTGVLVHKKHSEKIEAFEEALKNYGKEYCKDFNALYEHKLRRIE